MMKLFRLEYVIWVAVIALCCPVTGCFGGSKKTTQISNNTTLGQELMDLQSARDRGILSEREYERKRTELLKGKR